MRFHFKMNEFTIQYSRILLINCSGLILFIRMSHELLLFNETAAEAMFAVERRNIAGNDVQ